MGANITKDMECIWLMEYHPTTEDLDKWVSYLNENFNTEETSVGWCFNMGRVHVYAKGDLELISKAMQYYLPHLNNMLQNQWRKFSFSGNIPKFKESDLPQYERITPFLNE